MVERAAESLRDARREQRLGNALAGLARDLADARRQIASLSRENRALRAQIERLGQDPDGVLREDRPPDRGEAAILIGGDPGG